MLDTHSYIPHIGYTVAPEQFAGEEGEDMASWVKREYGKGAIDRAGDTVVEWWMGETPQGPEYFPQEAFNICENWRSSHGLPLNAFQSNLRMRAKRLKEEFIVAQRMKRLPSVLNKLAREENMKLSQDLGGCRAILPDVAAVDRLYGMYRGDAPLDDRESSLKCHDYIRHPKSDGYRGIHIVGRYQARVEGREAWNGHRIEIQLRSRLQHAFATTVETVTTFVRQPLKFGGGPPEWRRFFSLMGSVLAIRELTPLVDGTPYDEGELVRELKEHVRDLKLYQRLKGWTDTIRSLRKQGTTADFQWLLLVLDLKSNTISVRGFPRRIEASRELAKIEMAKNSDLDAVLVWVPDISELREAYPNYYADTREFISALDSALRPKLKNRKKRI